MDFRGKENYLTTKQFLFSSGLSGVLVKRLPIGLYFEVQSYISRIEELRKSLQIIEFQDIKKMNKIEKKFYNLELKNTARLNKILVKEIHNIFKRIIKSCIIKKWWVVIRKKHFNKLFAKIVEYNYKKDKKKGKGVPDDLFYSRLIDRIAFRYGWTKNYIEDCIFLEEAEQYLEVSLQESAKDMLSQIPLFVYPHADKKGAKKIYDNIKEQAGLKQAISTDDWMKSLKRSPGIVFNYDFIEGSKN